jgi:S1-C subfamily serine protease
MFATRCLRLLVVVLILGFGLSYLAPAFAGDAFDAQQLYRQNLSGTVLMLVNNGQGSGWIIDRERRLLVTNYHVIEKTDEPRIVFPETRDGRVIAERIHYVPKKNYPVGAVVYKDRLRDLALVRLPSLPADIRALPLAPEAPVPGQRVHTIGSPGVIPVLWVYSTGTVRAVFTTGEDWKDGPGVHVIATQIPINPGDSGGPMFDDEGRVVGVSDAYARDAQLMSLSIDVTEVRFVYERFLRQKEQKAKEPNMSSLFDWLAR